MKAVRSFAILIGLIVLAHSVVMGLDPHAASVSAHDLAHESVQAFVCAEDEGASQGARVPLDPSVLHPVVSSGPETLLHLCGVSSPAPDAPSWSGATLRAFLQVFLN